MRLTFERDGVVHAVRSVEIAYDRDGEPRHFFVLTARCAAATDNYKLDLDSASAVVTCERCAKEGRQ